MKIFNDSETNANRTSDITLKDILEVLKTVKECAMAVSPISEPVTIDGVCKEVAQTTVDNINNCIVERATLIADNKYLVCSVVVVDPRSYFNCTNTVWVNFCA